jgi:hypothetical protein
MSTTVITFILLDCSFVIFVLNLSDIASKYRMVTIFVVVDLYTIYHTRLIGVFIIYLHTQFYMTKCSGSVVTVMNPNAEEKFIGHYVVILN